MKFFVAIIITALLAFICGLFLPWWGIAIAAFIVALVINQSGGRSFLSGFIALLILWMGIALWIDSNNNSVLSKKIAMVLPLGGNTLLLILITSIVGGLVAGLAALTASFLRSSKQSSV